MTVWLRRDAGVPDAPAGDLGDSWCRRTRLPWLPPAAAGRAWTVTAWPQGGTAEPGVPERVLVCLVSWPPQHPEQDIIVPGLREGGKWAHRLFPRALLIDHRALSHWTPVQRHPGHRHGQQRMGIGTDIKATPTVNSATAKALSGTGERGREKTEGIRLEVGQGWGSRGRSPVHSLVASLSSTDPLGEQSPL